MNKSIKKEINAFIENEKTKMIKENIMKKRKAIYCKLIRKSNSNPGYFKYEVTIEEKDGSIHVEPAYGKDMQSALSRLIKKEITNRVFNPGFAVVACFVIMTWPFIVFHEIDKSPMYLAYTFGSAIVTTCATILWLKHIDKNDE